MSSGLARFRRISEYEFYRTAAELRVKLAKALMNENIVPKRWRPLITFPAIDQANLLIDHIRAAFKLYPYSEQILTDKKELQQFAIADLDGIDDKLQFLLDLLYYGKVDADTPMPPAIEECGELIDREEKLLNEWKKATKLLSNKEHG